MKNAENQLTINTWVNSRKKMTFGGCSVCICMNCLYWWSSRCPYGECWDDYRAKTDPYDVAHPDEPPRTWWSDWNKPGEQAHWCRGGRNYLNYHCEHFVKYKGQKVKDCLVAAVSVFQDGYVDCSIIESVGCERCYEEFERRQE